MMVLKPEPLTNFKVRGAEEATGGRLGAVVVLASAPECERETAAGLNHRTSRARARTGDGEGEGAAAERPAEEAFRGGERRSALGYTSGAWSLRLAL